MHVYKECSGFECASLQRTAVVVATRAAKDLEGTVGAAAEVEAELFLGGWAELLGEEASPVVEEKHGMELDPCFRRFQQEPKAPCCPAASRAFRRRGTCRGTCR